MSTSEKAGLLRDEETMLLSKLGITGTYRNFHLLYARVGIEK